MLLLTLARVDKNDIQFKAHSGIRVIHDVGGESETEIRIFDNLIDTDWQQGDDDEFGLGITLEGARVDSITSNLIRNNRIGLFLNSQQQDQPYAAGISQNVFLGHEAADRWAIVSTTSSGMTRVVRATENYWGSEDIAVIRHDLIRDWSQDPYYEGGISNCVAGCGAVNFVNYCLDADLTDPPLLNDNTLRIEPDATCQGGGSTWPVASPNPLDSSHATLIPNRGAQANLVSFDLVINQNQTLTIEAGAIVEFAPGMEILIEGNGKLVVEGEVGAPVIFRSTLATPAPGVWEGIRITGGSGSIIRHAEIYDAHIGIRITGTDTLVTDTTITNFGRTEGAPTEPGAGISLENFNGDIRGTIITGSGSPSGGDATGIRVRGGDPLLLENEISLTGTGFDIEKSATQLSNPRLVANQITNTRDDGIQVGEGSNPTIGPSNQVTGSGGYGIKIDLNNASDFTAPIHFNEISGSTSDELSITNVMIGSAAEARWNSWGTDNPSMEISGDVTIAYESFVNLSGSLHDATSLPHPPPMQLDHYLWGNFSTQTTLSDTAEAYYALGDIVVPFGVTLTIDAGVTVLFPEHAKLRVETGGKLEIKGTSVAPVLLDSEDPSATWGGIEIRGSSDSRIQYAQISHAFRAIDVRENSTVDIENSTISDYGGALLARTPGAGIYFVDSKGIAAGSKGIVGNTIESPVSGGEANYAIYVEASAGYSLGKDDLEIYSNTLTGIADVGIMLVGPAGPQIGVEDILDPDAATKKNSIAGTGSGIGIVLVGAGDAANNPNPIIKGNDLLTPVGIEVRDYFDSNAVAQTVDVTENFWNTQVVNDIEAKIAYVVDAVEEFGDEPAVEIDFSNFLLSSGGPASSTAATTASNAITNVANTTPVIEPALGTDLVVNFRLREDADVIMDIWDDGLVAYCAPLPRTFHDVPGTGSPVATETVFGLTANSDGSGSPHEITWDGKKTGGLDAPPGPYAFVLYASTTTSGEYDYAPVRVGRSKVKTSESTASFNAYKNEPYVAKFTASGGPQILTVWLKLDPTSGTACSEPGHETLIEELVLPEDEEIVVIWDGVQPSTKGTSDTLVEGLVSVEFTLMFENSLMPNGFILADTTPTLSDNSGDSIPFVRANPFAITPVYEQKSVLSFVSDQNANVVVKLLPPVGAEITLFSNPVTAGVETAIPLDLELSAGELRTAETGDFKYVIEATSDNGQTLTQKGMLRIDE